MPDENEKDILSHMRRTLEEIKSLLIVTNQEKLKVVKEELLREGSIKRQIYELCDGTNNNRSIATAIQKDEAYVRSYITRLRREGFIRTNEDTGNHEQIF